MKFFSKDATVSVKNVVDANLITSTALLVVERSVLIMKLLPQYQKPTVVRKISFASTL